MERPRFVPESPDKPAPHRGPIRRPAPSAKDVQLAGASERAGEAPALQRAGSSGETGAAVLSAAEQGFAGTGGRLPHLEQIQRSFGPEHDLSGVQAHVDPAASVASRSIGAEAYTSGERVAFRGAPSLWLASHEAAHVVQQREGVSLASGVGSGGDPYEQHADAVADRVVAGESAAPLVGPARGATRLAPGPAPAGAAVQRKGLVGEMMGDQRKADRDEKERKERIQAKFRQLDALGTREILAALVAMPPADLEELITNHDELGPAHVRKSRVWIAMMVVKNRGSSAAPFSLAFAGDLATLDPAEREAFLNFMDPARAFDKVGTGGVKEAEAPDKIKLPKPLQDGMQTAWTQSFPGGKSQEHGGLLVKKPDDSYKFEPGRAGKSGSFPPNYGDKKRDETLVAVAHTHPYDASEGGMTDVSFSGQDIARLVLVEDKVAMVQSDQGQFVVTRTPEFDAIVHALDQAGKNSLFKEIKKFWDDTFKAAAGTFQAQVEAAVRATCTKYHLVYYKGRGGELNKQ